MAFYYAELLFKLQRYDEAAKMYERSIDVEPHGSYTHEAAYAYVISTKNAVKTPSLDVPDAGPACPDMKPCAIPADVQRLIGAFGRYLALAAKTDKDSADDGVSPGAPLLQLSALGRGGGRTSTTSSPPIPTTSSPPTRRTWRWTAWRSSSAIASCARSSSG